LPSKMGAHATLASAIPSTKLHRSVPKSRVIMAENTSPGSAILAMNWASPLPGGGSHFARPIIYPSRMTENVDASAVSSAARVHATPNTAVACVGTRVGGETAIGGDCQDQGKSTTPKLSGALLERENRGQTASNSKHLPASVRRSRT
jgi:hypothetical protein